MTESIDRAFVTRQNVIRHTMLHTLYALRLQDDLRASGFVRDLTHALGHAPHECEFALKYLIDMQYVQRSGIQCSITAKGIEQFEKEFTDGC